MHDLLWTRKKSYPQTRKELHAQNCLCLKVLHRLTPAGLKRLSKTDEGAALNVIKHLYTHYRQKTDAGWKFLNPEEYERCDDPENWKAFPYKPGHLRQRRGIEKTPEYRRLISAFQESYKPESDRFLSILVELGPLDDMEKIRALAKEVAGSSLAYCKVERPAKSKALKHHLHVLVLATPQTVIPGAVGKYTVTVRELGQGKYAHDPIVASLHTFLLYLHKPYDSRIFAKGHNTRNLHRLLLEDFLGYDPNLARQPTPTRRWGLNLPY